MTKRSVRTGSVLGFVILSLAFGLSVFAQKSDDEPMGEKAAAALVEELKGVVTRIAPNKDEAKLVGERWDKRKHLGCKTKNDLIELLFEDVKAVIKDSGTQYQIYSTFAFYKNVDTDSEGPDGKKKKDQ